MNPQGFSFPPPPPPPPTQHQQQQQYPNNAAFTPYGQNHHGQRGGRGGGRGHFGARGRGHGNRGGGRGGHYMPSDANRSATYPPSTAGYGPLNHLGYPNQPMANQNSGAQPPLPNNQRPVNASTFASPPHYPQSSVHGTPYQQQSGYSASYSTANTQQVPTYGHVPLPHQHAVSSAQPTMMGPPMRWGFENVGYSGSFSGSQLPNQRGPRQFNAYNNQTAPRGHANKRDHSSAFGKPQFVAPRTPAPPPVPSFGNPLPSKPPAPADSPRKPKKKKRKHNQLGLTPKTEEHESSEEDDADEETRLAAGGGGVSAGLHVTYRGRTATLQTSAEIAAWIEERKKRFPTQAKIEEKKKAAEEAKKAKEEAQRKHKEARREAVTRAKNEQDKQGPREQPRGSLNPADAAAKAKQKAEKLRRKLEKEEKRIAQAEADAELARKREVSENATLDGTMGTAPTTGEGNQIPNLATQDPGTKNILAEPDLGRAPIGSEDGPQSHPRVENRDPLMRDRAVNVSASDASDSSDWTSSSGSDLSASDSDDSDDDSPPEQATSRADGPERVPPPPRGIGKRICRHFARNGRCTRGKHCKFLHEKPERGRKTTKPAEVTERKGLLQALLDRQKDDENRKVMETIVWLGENGFLDQPAAQVDASVSNTTRDV
ncbi:CCCH zinc finger protein [Aspergillus lucknowensis]|uniref:C3H1-type domain-containing protein n=1 Tax=Aspergillus lucknowensis TaxID=176173 RepID=A0ABR4M2P4_9EURO